MTTSRPPCPRESGWRWRRRICAAITLPQSTASAEVGEPQQRARFHLPLRGESHCRAEGLLFQNAQPYRCLRNASSLCLEKRAAVVVFIPIFRRESCQSSGASSMLDAHGAERVLAPVVFAVHRSAARPTFARPERPRSGLLAHRKALVSCARTSHPSPTSSARLARWPFVGGRQVTEQN